VLALVDACLDGGPESAVMVFVPLVVAAAAGAVRWMVFHDERRTLFATPDAFAPTLCALGAQAALSILARAAPEVSADWSLQLGALSFSLSLSFFVSIAIWIAHAAWATHVVDRMSRGEPAEPEAAFRPAMRRFVPFLLALLIGHGVLLGSVAVFVLLGPLAFVAIPAAAILWNLVTASYLVRVARGGTVTRSLADAAKHDAGRKDFRVPLAAHLVVLGIFTFAAWSTSRGGSHTSRSGWGVHGFWTGAYENESRWISKWAEISGSAAWGPAVLVATFALAALALCWKLRVARSTAAAAEHASA
jgi:hypothetical protein